MRLQLMTFNAMGLGLPQNSQEHKRMMDNVETMLKVDPYQKLRQHHKNMGCMTPDVVVVSLQEMVPLTIPGLLTNNDNVAAYWSRVINEVLNKKIAKKDPLYIARDPITMFGLALFVFVREELNPYISYYMRDNVRTGGIGPVALGEKGGVAVSMTVGQTTMCFVGAHLASGIGKLPDRIEDWTKVEEGIEFEGGKRVRDHEYVFWIGDMNSHLQVNSADETQRTQVALKNGDWQYLINAHDELTLQRRMPPIDGKRTMFSGYKEGLITFPPTHPLQPGKHEYIGVPHWADRILWRRLVQGFDGGSAHGILLLYDATTSITLSDHRPVTAILDVEVRAPSGCAPNFTKGALIQPEWPISMKPVAAPVAAPIAAPIAAPVALPNPGLPVPSAQPSIYPALPSNNPYNTGQMMTAINQIPEREYPRPKCGCTECRSGLKCNCGVSAPKPQPPVRYEPRVHLDNKPSPQTMYYIVPEEQIPSSAPETQYQYITAQPEPTAPTVHNATIVPPPSPQPRRYEPPESDTEVVVYSSRVVKRPTAKTDTAPIQSTPAQTVTPVDDFYVPMYFAQSDNATFTGSASYPSLQTLDLSNLSFVNLPTATNNIPLGIVR